MKSTAPTLLVSIAPPVAYIKVCGRATSESGKDFKSLINSLFNRGFSEFVLDLSDCLMMDSTFLGVLAGGGVKMLKASEEGKGTPIRLLNANERVRNLLDNLGVLHLFCLTSGANLSPDQCVRPDVGGVPPSREDLCRTSLEAHETLMEINPDNIPKFKDVTQFLAEDLAKLQREEGNGTSVDGG